jgi:predicted RNA-binding Zn-ribbon protein involved in translation (DUF1610 family)
MTKTITLNDEIMFQCTPCGMQKRGEPDDTLIEEEYLEASIADAIHEQFVSNSAFDAAANIVMRDCKQCGLNHMTKIRIGTLLTTRYTCTCGAIENANI